VSDSLPGSACPQPANRGSNLARSLVGLSLAALWVAGRLWVIPWKHHVPLWALDLPILLLAAIPICARAIARRRDALKHRRVQAGLCPTCGYNRAGIAAGAVCPECGTTAPPPQV